MIDAKLTYQFGANAPVVREWPGLSKKEVFRLERALVNHLLQMNELGEDAIAAGTSLNPGKVKATLTINFQLHEGTVLWHETTLVYPNTSDDIFAVEEGILNGQLTKMPDFIKQKERKGQGHGHGKAHGKP